MMLNAYGVIFSVLSNVAKIEGALQFFLDEIPFVGIIANMINTLANMNVSLSAISPSSFYIDLFKTLLIVLYFKINWMVISVLISLLAGNQAKEENKVFYKVNMMGWKCALLIIITAIVSKYADIVLGFLNTSFGMTGMYAVMFVVAVGVVSLSALLTKAFDRGISVKTSFIVVLINQVLKSILDGFITIVFCALVYLASINNNITIVILAIIGYIVITALVEELCRKMLVESI